MRANIVDKGADRYVVGEIERFDEKYMMFRRIMWDMPVLGRKIFFTQKMPDDNIPGYTIQDAALRNASWDLEREFGMGNRGGRRLLLDWERQPKGEFMPPLGLRVKIYDPAKATRDLKKVAMFFGASLAGVCELDRRWVYSHAYYPAKLDPYAKGGITDEQMTAGHSEEIVIPEEYKYAIVIAIEMDYELVKYSPTYIAGASAGLCYSKMPFIAAMVAQYIRGFGYKAIPMGNDTALSIPLAIDAGLGELARNGVLVTPEFGPRVRLCKVFTDLPLVPDRPIEFGIWDFCMKCKRCAEDCPSQAISFGEPTTEIHNESNSKGLLTWPVDGVKCIAFWERNHSGNCCNCIRVCPFNKPPGWLHDFVRWGIKNTRWLDSTFVKLDKLFGYGKQYDSGEYWSS